MGASVLLVDDDPIVLAFYAGLLRQASYRVHTCASAEAARELLAEREVELVVTDLQLPGCDGIELCRSLSADRPEMPVLVLTAHGNLDSAVRAIRAGAYDFLLKPVDPDGFLLALTRATKHRELLRAVRLLTREVEEARPAAGLLGDSAAMREVRALLAKVADVDVSVLLLGETGVGKEVAARELHGRSRRRQGPFVAINCAAVPEALLESELFGHERGAFSGAYAARRGLFAEANGGTLFLDELGELPLGLQPKLLRALQERRVRPVGGSFEEPVDVRVVAATNRSLEAAVEAGSFRGDLFYRLNVVQIELPPLRARGNDCLQLAAHFLARSSERLGRQVDGLSPAVIQALLAYPWPGNVRELQNAIERGVAVASVTSLRLEDLPPAVARYTPPDPTPVPAGEEAILPLKEVERRHILRVVEAVGGNKMLAARLLGVDRVTLYRKLERFASERKD